MLAEAIEVLAKVLAPVKILVFARYASDEVPLKELIEIPEMVPVTFKLPTLSVAILEVTNEVEEVKKNSPAAVKVLPDKVKYGVPVTLAVPL